MPKDSQTKMPKRGIKTSKKTVEPVKNKKQNESSDDEYDDDDDDESYHTDDNSDTEMDVHEYRKFLKNIFPSKHLDKKIKSGEKLKEILNNTKEEDEEEDIKQKKHSNKNTDSKKF